MWRVAPLAVIALVMAAFSRVSPGVSASSSGPPPAKTGGFGEMTCHECHWENPENDPPGRVLLMGIPETYTPGEAYLITVAVAHPDTKRAGFELAGRLEGTTGPGSTAGQLRSTDPRTQVIAENGISYIMQTEAGAAVTGAEGRWSFEWTAPAAGGPVIFHVAANAANGDASPLGDFVYSTTAKTRSR